MDEKALADMLASAHNQPPAHSRFYRTVWTFKHNFTSALAKCLVSLSPYTVPDNLAQCIDEFHARLDEIAAFNSEGMAEVELSTLTPKVYAILESIPCIMALNEPKSGHTHNIFVTRHSQKIDPDNDFIDIMALAQNITCEFATEADSRAHLDNTGG